MATVLEKVNEILDEKKEKIIPGNIKYGVKIFDVEGKILSLLQRITDYFKSNLPDKLPVLKRNMDVLKKGYPDLGEIVF